MGVRQAQTVEPGASPVAKIESEKRLVTAKRAPGRRGAGRCHAAVESISNSARCRRSRPSDVELSRLPYNDVERCNRSQRGRMHLDRRRRTIIVHHYHPTVLHMQEQSLSDDIHMKVF